MELEYPLSTFSRSNQDTSLVHRPAVFPGQWVQSGDLLADCSTSVGGEISLGQNILIAYMPWEGYNFEDAILVSERLVYDDLYTSIHIEKYELDIKNIKINLEEMTRVIPNVTEKEVENLDEAGIIKLGSWVKEGDILIGKVKPLAKNVDSNFKKFMDLILERPNVPGLDASLRASKGVNAKVIEIKLFKDDTLAAVEEEILDSFGKAKNKTKTKTKIKTKGKLPPLLEQKPVVSLLSSLCDEDTLLSSSLSSSPSSLPEGFHEKGMKGISKKGRQGTKPSFLSNRQSPKRSKQDNKKKSLLISKTRSQYLSSLRDEGVKSKQIGKSKIAKLSKKLVMKIKTHQILNLSVFITLAKLALCFSNKTSVSSRQDKFVRAKKGNFLLQSFQLSRIDKSDKNFYHSSYDNSDLKIKKAKENPNKTQRPFLPSRFLLNIKNDSLPIFKSDPFLKLKTLRFINSLNKMQWNSFFNETNLSLRDSFSLSQTKETQLSLSSSWNKNPLWAKSNKRDKINKVQEGLSGSIRSSNDLSIFDSEAGISSFKTNVLKEGRNWKNQINSIKKKSKNDSSYFIDSDLDSELNRKDQSESVITVHNDFESETTTDLKGVLWLRLYLADKRRIQVGDKMAGRHGNKGIISRILPSEDMPFLPDGTPLDMVLNPLGVPSRMNVGQIYECLLGLAGKYLGENYKVFPFDEIYGAEASRSFVYSKLYEARIKTGKRWLFNPNCPGKLRLYDGRNGESFDQTVTVGYAYMLRLVHMVDDKIHARSTGPYGLITQQPVRGRSRQGGQRLGEMEVWAIEGYGAAFVLLEMLTLKADDLTGRMGLWSNIILNKDLSIGTPESFRVLIGELKALCLDIGLFNPNLNYFPRKTDVLTLSSFSEAGSSLFLSQSDKSGSDVENKKMDEVEQKPIPGIPLPLSLQDKSIAIEVTKQNDLDRLPSLSPKDKRKRNQKEVEEKKDETQKQIQSKIARGQKNDKKETVKNKEENVIYREAIKTTEKKEGDEKIEEEKQTDEAEKQKLQEELENKRKTEELEQQKLKEKNEIEAAQKKIRKEKDQKRAFALLQKTAFNLINKKQKKNAN